MRLYNRIVPAKNSLKEYIENGYYHIYNRGVEKRTIFKNQQDYSVFLSYLKEYLLPKDQENLLKSLSDPNISFKEKDKILKLLRLNNFSNEIILLSYVLMPNHFHFLIKQANALAIDQFMNSLATRYTMYFNQKNKRVGPLYQGVYKAVEVITDEQLIYLTAYIHKQAIMSFSSLQGEAFLQNLYKNPSSLPEYLGLRKTVWINTEEILSFFTKINPKKSYESFIKQAIDYEIIKGKIIED